MLESERFDNDEIVYQDGVELAREVDKGFYPSVYFGRKVQETLGTNFMLDQKSINEGRAWWTKSDVLRDAKMRRPNHPDYDKTSIHIPEDVWKTLSSSKI